MTIDYTQIITPTAKTEGRRLRRREAARMECRRRIMAVANETTQINVTAAASAGLLTADQMTAWRAALGWVAAMRANWRTLAQSGADLSEDANWPALPAGVAELAAAF